MTEQEQQSLARHKQWAQTVRNYVISFYQGNDILVSTKNAAKAKYAILSGIKCFTIEDSLYMTSNIASITKQREQRFQLEYDLDLLSASKDYLDARKKVGDLLKMDSYLDSKGKLLEKPKLQLT